MKAYHQGKEVQWRDYKRFYDVIDYVADNYPDKYYSYIRASGEEEIITYKEFRRKALCCLDTLQKKGIKKGDILLVETVDPKQYHMLLGACVYGGIVMSPLAQPNSWEIGSDGLKIVEKMWKKIDKPIIVTDAEHVCYYEEMQKTPDFEGLTFISMNEFTSETLGEKVPTELDDMAYIQFSSGTTGDPKGTILTYHNIIYTSRSMADCIAVPEDGVGISWLPHTHNLGVFIPVVLSMLFCNNQYFMTPATFIGNPSLFVEKVAEHQVSWTVFNNFGIDWMTKQVPDELVKKMDLSKFRVMLAGAENISKPVIEHFLAKYGPVSHEELQIRVGYGLSETTLAIAITEDNAGNVFENISRKEMMVHSRAVPTDDENDTVHLTGNGVVLNGIAMRIANDDGETLEEREIGEIQVRGECLFKTYYGTAPEDLENMKDGGWLATGDLGYFLDGILFIVGRKKDVVIIRGVNYMVADLEDIIYKKLGRPRGTLALTSVMNKETNAEELIVFVETEDSYEDFVNVRKDIIEAINKGVELNLSMVIPVKHLDKTSSGKIQRYLMKMKYENGFYQNIQDALAPYLQKTSVQEEKHKDVENEIEAIVKLYWSEVLNVDASSLSTDEYFGAAGGNSVQAFQVIKKLSDYYKCEFGHDMLVRCKTIKEMALYIKEFKEEMAVEEEENKRLEQAQETEIAITGLAFRLPYATTQEQLWKNLCEGKDCITQISEPRRQLVKAPDWDDWMGELEGVASFDYDFFEISEQEALVMDPQQRLITEVSYEALEDAGIITDHYDEEKHVGVYAGLSANTYFPLVINYVSENGTDNVDPHALIGNLNNITAARISHLYNFTGPVVAMDTACSSFCVSLHHASAAIRNGEAEGAVVTSANIISVPAVYALAKRAGIISSTNQSKVFDVNADGSILGEGVIVVYLEKLENAKKNNKHIYGVIKGSAVNNDGFALSIMSPNPKGQYEVMKEAYANANVNPNEISYIEAHGTGTKIGDPIEINALSRVYSKPCKENGNRISIGSVKTNIGHLLAAAGGASLTKVLMCLKNKQLVPSIHMENVNPLLEIEKTPFDIVTEQKDWVVPEGKKRLAGICSLGLGGTNAHIIVEEFEDDRQVKREEKPQVLTISAKSEEALEQLIQKTQSFMQSMDCDDIQDLCFTRNRYRRHYEYRAACILNAGEKTLDTIQKGKCRQVLPSKVAIAIGDVRSNGTQEEFEEWVTVLEQLENGIVRFNYFAGEKSGKILADYLSGNIDKETAKERYVKNIVSEESISLEDRKVPDILLGIGLEEGKMPQYDTEKNVLYIEMEQKLEKDCLIPSIIQKLYLEGANFNWDVLYPDGSGRMITLPAYPFRQNKIWIN